MNGGPEVQKQLETQENIKTPEDVDNVSQEELENVSDSKTLSEEVKKSFEQNEYNDKDYDLDCKKLIDFIKDRSAGINAYYFEGIWQLKEQDYSQKISDFNKVQISDLISQYNKKNLGNQINKTSFEKKFDEKKTKIELIKNEGEFPKNNINETQQVSEFIISPEQENNIKNTITNIIKNKYDVSRIELIGKASGDKVSDYGKIKAKNAIDNFLKQLENKGFDVSKLPKYDDINKQSWFDQNNENKNPGNHAWAYARALMQLNVLSSEELKYISKSKIDFNINSSQEVGDENTGGGINFYGYFGDITTKIREKNEILRQWIDVRFKITDGNNINIMKDFTSKIDNNISQDDVLNSGPVYKSWQNLSFEERQRKPGQSTLYKNTSGSYDALINLTKEQSIKYKDKIENIEKLSFVDFCDIFNDVKGSQDPQLNQIKDTYLAYQKIQQDIKKSQEEVKFN